MENNKKNFFPGVIILVLVASWAVATAGFWYYSKTVPPTPAPVETKQPAPPSKEAVAPPQKAGAGAEGEASQNPSSVDAPVTQPAITVLAPKKGSVFSLPNEKINFSWEWSGVADPTKVSMDLLDQNGHGVYGKIAGAGDFSYSESGGSGLIPAPVNLVIPTGAAQYRVRICAARNKTDCGFSEYFTINKAVATTIDPNVSIEVVAPSADEILVAGQQYTIKWKISGLPSNGVQSISVMNGTRGTINDPNFGVVGILPAAARSYTWTVSPNDGNWGLGLGESLWHKTAAIFGIETAFADSRYQPYTNQYVIRVSASAPGVLGEVGWGVSKPFAIKQPKLEEECVSVGGVWDEPAIYCECPDLFHWYYSHGCIPEQGKWSD